MAHPIRIQTLEAAEKDNRKRQQERRRDLRLRLADLVLRAVGTDGDLQRAVAALVAALPTDDRAELRHAFPRLKPVPAAGVPDRSAAPAGKHPAAQR